MRNDFQRKQAVYGCILGQAIGDALGHPLEFGRSINKQVPELKPGAQFTDDTQMMDAIARALLAAPPHQVGGDAFMVELSKQFVSWQRNPLGGSHRSPGGACMSGCSRLAGGTKWAESGGLSSKGNGSAMRSSVVGAYYHHDIDMAWRVGCLTSVPTHNNLEAILCAGAVSLLVACSIHGMTFSLAISEVLRRIEKWEETVPSYPKQVAIGAGYSEQNPWYVATHLGTAFAMGKTYGTDEQFHRFNGDDFATVPATAAAIYYNTRYSTFDQVTKHCAADTSDADTTTAIAGAIAGARFTYTLIPKRWRENVELSRYFHELAQQIWEASEAVPDTTTSPSRTQ